MCRRARRKRISRSQEQDKLALARRDSGTSRIVNCRRRRTPGTDGHYPAMEYAKISPARKIIRDRKGLGLSQVELAGAWCPEITPATWRSTEKSQSTRTWWGLGGSSSFVPSLFALLISCSNFTCSILAYGQNRGDRTPIKLFTSGYREIPGLRLGRPVAPEWWWGAVEATIADLRNFSNVSKSFWRRPLGRRTHRPTRFPADLFRLRLNSVIAAAPAAKSSTDVGSGMVSSYTVPRLLVPPCSVVP